MKLLKILVLMAVMATVAMLAMQRAGLAQAASNLRVTQPQNGQKFDGNIVPGIPGAEIHPAGLSKQNAPASSENSSLPQSGGALPLLSVIGFGVLVGGIASALKTR